MVMKNFKEFVDKKARETRKQLELLSKLFEKRGMLSSSFVEEEDPYIFLKTPNGSLSFDGIRIYKIGSNLAYRVQKQAKTHPYGKAYPLDVEDMWEDLLSDNMDEQKAGEEVVKAIEDELKKFFEKSSKAEKELRSQEFDKPGDPMGRMMVKSGSL